MRPQLVASAELCKSEERGDNELIGTLKMPTGPLVLSGDEPFIWLAWVDL